MKKIKHKSVSLSLALTALLSLPAQAQSPLSWRSENFWKSAVSSNLNFFRNHAWDENSGSYASELDADGKQYNNNRDIVALSRLIYADATAPSQDLRRARRSADFLLKSMTGQDAHGLYFKSVVDDRGVEVSSGRNYSFIFEQSYPLTGLVALYSAAPAANADLLPVIRKAAQSFWKRFHDDQNGGLFYYYNFSTRDHANDQALTHKSYQSHVYPMSSFLFSLRKADPDNRKIYDSWIRELLAITTRHIVERSHGSPTGWLIERMDSKFSPDTSYPMTEAGHITQLVWVLGMAVSEGIVTESSVQKYYLKTAEALLSKFIAHGGFSPLGTVYDAFDRTTGKPWSENGATPTTAWWSNLEAVIAYAFAVKTDLLGINRKNELSEILNRLTHAYSQYFMDSARGGEFFRIDAEKGHVVDSTKGGPGKSAYHIGEVYEYLFGSPDLATEAP